MPQQRGEVVALFAPHVQVLGRINGNAWPEAMSGQCRSTLEKSSVQRSPDVHKLVCPQDCASPPPPPRGSVHFEDCALILQSFSSFRPFSRGGGVKPSLVDKRVCGHPDFSVQQCADRVHCKGEAQRSKRFWRFSWGGGFAFLRCACSRGIPVRDPLDVIKSPVLINTACNSTCLTMPLACKLLSMNIKVRYERD